VNDTGPSFLKALLGFFASASLMTTLMVVLAS
jgi:hypothetical protein